MVTEKIKIKEEGEEEKKGEEDGEEDLRMNTVKILKPYNK
jgi:hypothetical protein